MQFDKCVLTIIHYQFLCCLSPKIQKCDWVNAHCPSSHTVAILGVDYNVIGALRGCRAVKFDSCNNLLSSVHNFILHWYHSAVCQIEY